MCYSWDRLAHVKMYVSVFRCATAGIDSLMSRCMSMVSGVLSASVYAVHVPSLGKSMKREDI